MGLIRTRLYPWRWSRCVPSAGGRTVRPGRTVPTTPERSSVPPARTTAEFRSQDAGTVNRGAHLRCSPGILMPAWAALLRPAALAGIRVFDVGRGKTNARVSVDGSGHLDQGSNFCSWWRPPAWHSCFPRWRPFLGFAVTRRTSPSICSRTHRGRGFCLSISLRRLCPCGVSASLTPCILEPSRREGLFT
jgi:hypothetical protein